MVVRKDTLAKTVEQIGLVTNNAKTNDASMCSDNIQEKNGNWNEHILRSESIVRSSQLIYNEICVKGASHD